jgi:hypothetical protein
MEKLLTITEHRKLNKKTCSNAVIDTPRQIAQTLLFSLRCVDALQSKGLRSVF